MKALLDNDVFLKGCCYKLLDELVLSVCSSEDSLGVLGAARFVVESQIRKRGLSGKLQDALDYFRHFLKRTEVVEPTTEEQFLAADLELAGSRAGVSLDSGESQLCAILVLRMVPTLVTGDKRAMRAVERLLDVEERLMPICGCIRCLEQLVLAAVSGGMHKEVRDAVCLEPGVDKTLTICFSCTSGRGLLESSIECLNSYIDDLRASAPRVLAP
jgi:hypothetical protein